MIGESVEKKNIYIRGSLKLFLKYGIRSVTVGQITQTLNISSKTLYNIFGDKTGLVRECFDLYKNDSQLEYNSLKENAQNIAETLIKFYRRSVEAFNRVNPNFFNDIAKYFPELWDNDEAFGKHRTQELLVQGINEGIFVAHVDTEIASRTITILLKSMLEDEAFYTQGNEALFSNIIWPYLRGICTQKGREEFRKFRSSPS
ncbi:MAG: TetR/AcrR family transcriptional regulator [Bacteroidia bacterium]|nr:TetR/AcrR family transcriptional regulator [Bacteroidia bacterium]